ncbi:hypothetical protein PVK06_005383 [Gossypium arboreum]|uniref:Small ribosomal subunit protein uS2c n=1 Tax=Gossypium arboreum TaxID=29729 RepID=A0ABR0QVF6_GOSAR|nr:hypothetical protein PVK06_005383 [Gossypium arboreum]
MPLVNFLYKGDVVTHQVLCRDIEGSMLSFRVSLGVYHDILRLCCDIEASKGKQFLIVGTKNKAADSVARAAIRARCHYVNKKWLGGMLTNWPTTETRLHKFWDLRTEQKTGGLNRLPKRDAAMLKRQLSRLQTYLGGIKYMTRLPDIVIIVDQ